MKYCTDSSYFHSNLLDVCSPCFASSFRLLYSLGHRAEQAFQARCGGLGGFLALLTSLFKLAAWYLAGFVRDKFDLTPILTTNPISQ
jgi:hypothetical protein